MRGVPRIRVFFVFPQNKNYGFRVPFWGFPGKYHTGFRLRWVLLLIILGQFGVI